MANNTETGAVEVRAVAKFVRVAPRKARLVVDQIRNKSCDKALEILQFSEVAASMELSVSLIFSTLVTAYVLVPSLVVSLMVPPMSSVWISPK